jgi:hypothetical protein
VTPVGNEGVEVREDLWPILFIRLRGRVHEDQWIEIFHAYSRLYARRERYCSVVDTSQIAGLPSATSRNLIARLAKEHENQSRSWIVESNVVIVNSLARGALTAVHWLSPPVYPIYYVASCEEAFARAFSALAREKRPVPDAVRAFVATIAGDQGDRAARGSSRRS